MTTRTFDIPLHTSAPLHCGNLRITYNEYGFMYADYYMNRSSLGDRLPGSLLQSTLFKPVMEEIEGAIENNKRSEETEEDIYDAARNRRNFLDNHSHLIIDPS